MTCFAFAFPVFFMCILCVVRGVFKRKFADVDDLCVNL